jgi:hypothetical protein
MTQKSSFKGVAASVLLALTLALSTGGCATYQKLTPQQTKAHLDTWIGRSTDDLMLTWGTPIRSSKLEDGRTVLDYEHTNDYSTLEGANWTCTCKVTVITASDSKTIEKIIPKGSECNDPYTMREFFSAASSQE